MQNNTHVYYYNREGGSNKQKRKAERRLLFYDIVAESLPALRWLLTILSIQMVTSIFFEFFNHLVKAEILL